MYRIVLRTTRDPARLCVVSFPTNITPDCPMFQNDESSTTTLPERLPTSTPPPPSATKEQLETVTFVAREMRTAPSRGQPGVESSTLKPVCVGVFE
jgi:hypothetical protein